jgi:hypothetical protein
MTFYGEFALITLAIYAVACSLCELAFARCGKGGAR